MSAHLFASSVVALIVALFNGLLAGYVLASARGERRKLFFACGPTGVALFALGWFVVLLEPRARESVRVAVGLAALMSVSGFVADALVDLGPSRARQRILWALLPAGLALLGFSVWVAMAYQQPLLAVLPQMLGLAGVGLLGALRLVLCRHENGAIRRLSRHLAALIGVSLLVCLLRTVLELIQGGATGNGMLLCIVLAAEMATLSYTLHERVAVQLPVSRALTHAVLAIAVACAVVAVFRVLGYPVDLVQVTVSVMVALLAALLFIGLSEQLNRVFDQLLFPKQVRLSEQLSASRAETAALRSRLERAERLAIAGELAASVAHEIKNPLAAVRGYAELLSGQAGHVTDEQRARFEKAVRIIREESDRIDARVAELLSLGRAPRGEKGGSPLDVSRIVLEAVAVAEGEPGFPTLVSRLDPDLRAEGDEDALRGVLLNLLKNAAEAMHETRDGRIEVVARGDKERVVVEVRDEGKGLEAVDRERLFRPFYTTKEGGTGLGLAISRSAIESAGGKLGLVPRTDRPGAIARVELPVAQRGPGPAREDVQ
ncbi:sensor histidine kinase [Archangium lansingense]|uniref:sensor histidine kinase n=1 Tax=Archangium lansingense TaxID=2995310 RepID=UPI003B82AC92